MTPPLRRIGTIGSILAFILILQKLVVLAHGRDLTFPTILLHLSDIHVSSNAQRYWASFGDREGDFKRFASSLVPAINPAAVLITGDLTDSKDPSGAGLQQEAEWKGYSELLDALHSAGIPSSNVVDVRGNHDGFGLAVPRGHAKDYFAQHSASAKRGNATDRVVSYVLLPSPKNGAPLLASTSEWLSQAGNDTASCPAVALLGVDFSKDPGLKNPLNFVGHADAELTRTIRSQGAAFSGCRPAIIAFGHYPLSTVDHRPAGLWASAWILGAFKHAAGRADAMQGAAAAISSLPATAYVSGHLHTAFGERMHHAHPAHADVLLDKNSKNTAAPTHVLAELETGAWKDDRRFRIASVDNGAFAFIDLYYVSNGTPGRRRRSDAAARARTDWREAFQGRGGWGVTPTDQTATVNDHIALITWPPDARLSPQPAVSEDAYPEGTVRAAVFPLSPLTNEDQEIINVTVVGFLPGQEMHFLHSQLQLVSSKMSDKGNQFWRRERVKGVSNENSGGMVVFSGVPHASVLCTATGAFGADHRLSRCGPPSDMVYLQVIVENGLGRPSTSPRVPAALRCRKSERRDGSQDCWAAPAKKPAPLNVGWLEAFMLQVNWPVLMHRVYLITWALGLWLLLLLPRRVAQGGTWVRRVYSSPLFQKYAVPQSQYPTWSSIRAMDAGMIQALPPLTLRARLSAALLWPGAALVLVASRPRVWFALVFYWIYLILGPIFAANVMNGRRPLAWAFHFGVWGKFHGSTWEFVPTPDTLLIAMMHLILCVVPLTLWIGCVVGQQLLELKHSNKSGGEHLHATFVRWPHLVSLAALAAVNGKILYIKSWEFMGAVSLLVSPGFAWAIPLAVGLVCAAPLQGVIGQSAGVAKGE